MTKTFTQSDLIRFIYQETTKEEAQEIELGLSQDLELQRQYRSLLLTKKNLDQANLEPPSSVTDRILAYSQGLEVKH